ncbi:MAG: hypothetical protein EON92_00540 [Burkholderiales bacterium]|nr:MAG: hypothetical protein EON92_00540 [Burkholderiales bacterium]
MQAYKPRAVARKRRPARPLHCVGPLATLRQRPPDACRPRPCFPARWRIARCFVIRFPPLLPPCCCRCRFPLPWRNPRRPPPQRRSPAPN